MERFNNNNNIIININIICSIYCLIQSLFRSIQATAFLYRKNPLKGKNLGASFQLVLYIPPSPNQYIIISFYLPYVLYFLSILEDLGGGSSRRVWQFASVVPITRQGMTSPQGARIGRIQQCPPVGSHVLFKTAKGFFVL